MSAAHAASAGALRQHAAPDVAGFASAVRSARRTPPWRGRSGCGRRSRACRRSATARARNRAEPRARAASCPAPGSRPSGRAYRGDAARRTASAALAVSTISPAYITATRCATRATTPRSCVMSRMRDAEVALQVDQQPQDLRLDGDVERGRRLVGDQQRRPAHQRHGDHHALAQAAGKLVRILPRAARPRPLMPTCSSSSTARARAARPRRALVPAMHLGKLVADGVGRD